eukprot:TRINITY_DN112249_c0_g1_i1.p1 TRINITY_DN112249_c0_g1~~TRINITY_DN112249_c0_g1_i1.p1  ORF type:complete len:310 (-),score=66.26 TRINITY_DN112249_c0_g1_i1:119-1048(-)
MEEDGGTGASSNSSNRIAATPPVAAAELPYDDAALPAAEAATAELYGDLHEYGLSLGVDIDAEGEEDLSWAVQEAFNAPLPNSWTEYMDETGRAYYVKEGSSQSTWEHPMDGVYTELLDLVRRVRSQKPPMTEAQRTDFVRAHLEGIHETAKAELADWSGPYASEQGDFYYNERLKASSWETPVNEWENELETRHRVLVRYLLPEQASPQLPGAAPSSSSSSKSPSMLQALRLQLGNLHREPGPVGAEVPEPSTSRSFYTARSATSSRSGRSKHGHKDRRKEKKSKREDGGAEGSRSSKSDRLADLPEG